MALPDQPAPLLGSVAVSGAAEATVWVGVDICSDDRLPALPHVSDSCPCDPDKLAELLISSSTLFPEFGAGHSGPATHAQYTPFIGRVRVRAKGERAAEGALLSPPGPASDQCRVSFF